ncbi:ArsR family transcriptional regulator [Nocardia sp. CA2R105]|uniref:ArsR/SmtB family transcription factor n=1 Tax=Nocardia coffeae TaxID=2873381 RepID=UPI001CA7B0F0|nr:metalloregulator ArsR/SmtB family transcription factor [Nocardia coffeae]MBY8857837.1 ArsR family transcriptional regulator [Nocardia coffeae]
MDAFGVLGNPARRQILELLASGEKSSGAITRTISEQRGISEAAVSQHLKALLDNGLATVRPAGMNRFYTVDIDGLHRLTSWLSQFPQPPRPDLHSPQAPQRRHQYRRPSPDRTAHGIPAVHARQTGGH